MSKKEMLLSQNEIIVQQVIAIQEKIITDNQQAYINCYKLQNIFLA